MTGPMSFERFTVTTGGEEEAHIARRRDTFFDSVVTSLGLPAENPFTERTARSLSSEHPSELRLTDDWLHLLIVFDEAVAMVLDRRNSGNYHEVTFWRNEPSRECLGRIAAAMAMIRPSDVPVEQ